MSKAFSQSIVFSIAAILLIGLALSILLKNQVIALSPPEISPTVTPAPATNPSPTTIPTPISDPGPCFATGDVLHVYSSNGLSGCRDLGVALLRVATQTDKPKEVFVHTGTYELDTQEFVDARSPSFGVLLQNIDHFRLRGETGSDGKNLASIVVKGSKGLFLLENSTVTLESLNFSGSTTNGLLHAEAGSNLTVRKVHSEYSGSNVFEINGANSATFYQNYISNGVGAIHVNGVGNTSIIYNTIINNSRGIIVSNGPAEIKYNLLVDNAADGHAIYLTNSGLTSIFNNTIVQSQNSSYAYPLRISKPHLQAPTTIQYNIISSVDGGLDVELTYESAVNIQENNIFAIKSAYNGIADRTGALGNISADPLFGENYCLRPGSPSMLSSGLFMGHAGPCEQAVPSPINDELISRIHINPGQLTTTIGSERILFSAQAMKLGEGDIENATYEWGMSSDNSIGTLFSDQSNQKQAWFTPVRAGRGDVWVTVRIGDYYKTASVPVVVSKLCQERDSCSTDACIQLVPSGGWCASEVLPGDVDFNNTVNHEDIIQFKQVFDKKFYPADFNFDGRVNIYDFLYIIKNFGLSVESIDGTSE